MSSWWSVCLLSHASVRGKHVQKRRIVNSIWYAIMVCSFFGEWRREGRLRAQGALSFLFHRFDLPGPETLRVRAEEEDEVTRGLYCDCAQDHFSDEFFHADLLVGVHLLVPLPTPPFLTYTTFTVTRQAVAQVGGLHNQSN